MAEAGQDLAYDVMVKELAFDLRARAAERTKTPEGGCPRGAIDWSCSKYPRRRPRAGGHSRARVASEVASHEGRGDGGGRGRR